MSHVNLARHFTVSWCYTIILLSVAGCGKNFELKYYDSGVVKSKMEIKDNEKDGEMFRYYESGALMARGTMRSGQQEGKLEWFYESGELEEVDFYIAGKSHGLVTKYYKNGQVRSTLTYEHDKPIGKNVRFGVDGSLTELAFYDSMGSLYYLTLWDSLGRRKMQAFMPVFSINVKRDSIYILAKSKIDISGTADLFIGPWNQQLNEISVLAKIRLTGTASVTTVIPNRVAINELFYKMEFRPSDADSIKGFEFYKQISKANSTIDSVKHLLD